MAKIKLVKGRTSKSRRNIKNGLRISLLLLNAFVTIYLLLKIENLI